MSMVKPVRLSSFSMPASSDNSKSSGPAAVTRAIRFSSNVIISFKIRSRITFCIAGAMTAGGIFPCRCNCNGDVAVGALSGVVGDWASCASIMAAVRIRSAKSSGRITAAAAGELFLLEFLRTDAPVVFVVVVVDAKFWVVSIVLGVN